MERLKTRAQFQEVLAGLIVSKTTHFALHRQQLGITPVPPSNSDHLPLGKRLFQREACWIGAMVPKRWAKRAVTRNLIKRQIYSVSAEFSQNLPKVAFVIRLRGEFHRAQFVSARSAQLKTVVRDELQALMYAGLRAT